MAILAAFALAGCGGGGGGDSQPAQMLAPVTPPATDKPAPTVPGPIESPPPQPPVPPAPAPSPTPVPPTPVAFDLAPYIKVALGSVCADYHNRLYTIDGTYVLSSRAGNCPDASYGVVLFKGDAKTALCSLGDSIAGPQTHCAAAASAQERALFDTLAKNRNAAGLGLDASHTVEKTDLGTQLTVTQIEENTWSQIFEKQNLVIKNRIAFTEVWNRHAPGKPLPEVDFTRKMVIALFSDGYSNGCYRTQVTAVRSLADKLLVLRSDIAPSSRPDAPIRICPAAISHPAHIVTVDRVELPVEFIEEQVEQ